MDAHPNELPFMSPASPIANLPAEVLVQCFEYLPFLDRFTVVHVSRHWRSCALSFPALWADIRLSAALRTPAHIALLDLALSRSGTQPIDFECVTIFDVQDTLVQLLSKHMHHLRSITWYGSIDSVGFTRAAPVLERYVCKSWIPIPSSFLGGQPGVLRHVELARLALPPTCPVFSTVTHLDAHVAGGQGARTLRQLFSIFPSLVRLALRGLPADSDRLPEMGRAPATLVHLFLQTERDDCNLSSYVLEIAPEGCTDVRLSMPVHASAQLAVFLADAHELAIQPWRIPGQSEELESAVMTLPDGRLITLDFAYPAYLQSLSDVLVHGLLSAPTDQPQLRALTMPLYTLHKFFRTRPALPALADICIVIQQTASGVVDMTRLYCLALLQPYALSFCAVEVRTCSPDAPSAEAAKLLISYIVRHGQPGVRYVLRGFSRAVADAVVITTPGGLAIEFDVACPPSAPQLSDTLSERARARRRRAISQEPMRAHVFHALLRRPDREDDDDA